MTAYHKTGKAQKAYERLCNRVPAWLPVDWDLIANMADLEFQIDHELDLYAEGDEPAIKTKRQLHQVKMLHADIGIARMDEARR